ncbi:MAG: 2-dehydro-3-deoxygluconokinase [Firmicutes bacterium]|nr:2-dehydro-3-deoxygluconokinase [Bacillota bacterium]
MLDVITMGESMVMMIAEQAGPLECATTFSRHLAGAESNVAIGLARLGHKSGWISAVGEDPFGTYVLDTICGEGVDNSAVVVLPSYPTGLLIKEQKDVGDPKVYYYRRGSAASHYSADLVPKNYFDKAKILHITGIFPALSEITRQTLLQIIRHAKKCGLLISFDPNVRLQLWSKAEARKTLLEISEMSDVILPGVAEAELLLGTSDWSTVASSFHEKGNQYVVMKNGPDGAYYSVKGGSSGYEKGFKVERVVDTVGAGDGFAVGVLSGILDQLPIHQAVARGNAIGSLAVTVRGDYDGYPSRERLSEYLTMHARKQ